MPPKKTAGVAKAKKARAPKNSHQLAEPLRAGTVLTDNHKKQWKVGAPVGSGGFGLIYLGSEVGGKDGQYVIKVEPHANGPLFCELHFYMRVAKPELISKWLSDHKLKSLGVPKYIASGAHEYNGSRYRFMVMQRFGADLQTHFEENGKRFPLKAVYQLAIRIVDALEYIHDNEYVHADIKASNLLMGYTASSSGQVFLVDYGLAFRYTAEGKHKPYKEDPRRAHDGTIEFTSTDAHRGVVPARRGDMEILGYCLLQWLCGKLPWESNLNNKEYVAKEKFRYAKDIPGLFRACFPKGDGPDALKEYMKYVMDLDYEQRPDYNHIRQLFQIGLKKSGLSDDGKLVFASKTPKSPKSAGKKASRKRTSSEEDEVASPKRTKKVNGHVLSPVGATTSPGRKTTPKQRAVPHKPIGIWTPKGRPASRSPTKPATPRSSTKPATPSKVRKLKADLDVHGSPANPKAKPIKGGRVKRLKNTSSVGTQTSPGLKGLRRSRKT